MQFAGIGQARVGVRASVRIQARSISGGIDDSEGIVFGQKRVLKYDSRLEVVDALYVSDYRRDPGIGERAILANGLELQIRRKDRRRDRRWGNSCTDRGASSRRP